MSPQFVRNGNMFRISTDSQQDLYPKLPVGTYSIGFNPEIGYYFSEIDSFILPEKLYGNVTKRANRILQTYKDRPFSTGVLMTGDKGSGKTLLAKYLSVLAAKQDIPTLVVNSPYAGESFNKFMQKLNQEIIIIFDEFEKVYTKDHQEMLLTLLDGIYNSKKLFILTSNQSLLINTNMTNRPGRIYYRFDYTGLEEDFIKDYCQDKLNNKSWISHVVALSKMYDSFNFDVLQAIVEESNRYEEHPMETISWLNARPDFNKKCEFLIKNLVIDGVQIPDELNETNPMSLNPFKNFDFDPIIARTKIENPTEHQKFDYTLINGEYFNIEYESFCIEPRFMINGDIVNSRFSFETDNVSFTLIPHNKKASKNKNPLINAMEQMLRLEPFTTP